MKYNFFRYKKHSKESRESFLRSLPLAAPPDLSRDKSGRACLPRAGALPRQPSQARPDFLTVVCCTTPVGLRLAPSAKGPGVLPLASHLFGPKWRLMCWGVRAWCVAISARRVHVHRAPLRIPTAQRPPRRAGWGGGSCLCTADTETGRGLRRSRLAGKRRAAT